MKKLFLILLAIATVIGLTSGACKSEPAVKKEILVGYTASLTGAFAGFGVGHTFGAQAAIDDINAQGGVYVKEYGRKLPIKLIVRDTESDPLKVATLAEQLATLDNIDFFITGNEPPAMHVGVANAAARYKIPHIGRVAVMEPWLEMRAGATPPWEYTWATGFSIAAGAQEGDFRYQVPGYTILSIWLPAIQGVADKTNKTVGIFGSDDPDGRGWYMLSPTVLEASGFTVSGIDKKIGLYTIGTTDFSSIVNKWKEDHVEILWGNCIGPDLGIILRQAQALGFQPKMVLCGRAPCNYVDVTAWGGDLPLGICVESNWSPEYHSPGIGDTTPQSLAARWSDETGQPINFNVGLGYYPIQVLVDAIERAGTLDANAINNAIAKTDLMTLNWRVKFDKNQFSIDPLNLGQWQKIDAPEQWEMKIVASPHEFIRPNADLIFPIPYK